MEVPVLSKILGVSHAGKCLPWSQIYLELLKCVTGTFL